MFIETSSVRVGYILPFVSSSWNISQWYNGHYSHKITYHGLEGRSVQDDRR